MKLTKNDALKLHREMWSDMQEQLGDDPEYELRSEFKKKWCESHYPNEYIYANCFLCEYDESFYGQCDFCPIDWGEVVYDGCSKNSVNYWSSPISEILALPDREINEQRFCGLEEEDADGWFDQQTRRD